MMQTTSIHIKVELAGEFRRFALATPTFQTLESVLRELYELKATDELKVKFLDDEKDWVLIASDQELLYAVELTGTPLRLSLKVLSVEGTTSTTSTTTATDAPVSIAPRGRGRGGRGKGLGLSSTQQERLKGKSDRITERITALEAKLSSGNLNSERERVLRWRLQNLQNKLSLVNQKQQSLESALSDGNNTNKAGNVEEPTAERGCRGRGGRGRGLGRGGRGKGLGRFASEAPAPETPETCETPTPTTTTTTGRSPSLISSPAHFLECRANLKAARRTGNEAEIKTCLAAFKEAKEAMQANPGMAKLRECRLQKKQCLANLREAQSKGDESQIQTCKTALTEATRNLHQVKATIYC